jgi:hypothetical protein
MKKNRTILVAIVIICLAFVAGLSWRWVQGTPYYCLYQIGAGLKDRDLNTVLAYVDLESVLSQQLSGPVSKLLASPTASGSLGKIAGSSGEIKIQLTPELNKSLSRLAANQLRIYLENPKNTTLPSSFLLLSLAKFKVEKDVAQVTLKYKKDQLRMQMRRQEGFWRVVELEPDDTLKLIKTYILPPAK